MRLLLLSLLLACLPIGCSAPKRSDPAKVEQTRIMAKRLMDSVTVFTIEVGRLPMTVAELEAEMHRPRDPGLPPRDISRRLHDAWGKPLQYHADGPRAVVIAVTPENETVVVQKVFNLEDE